LYYNIFLLYNLYYVTLGANKGQRRRSTHGNNGHTWRARTGLAHVPCSVHTSCRWLQHCRHRTCTPQIPTQKERWADQGRRCAWFLHTSRVVRYLLTYNRDVPRIGGTHDGGNEQDRYESVSSIGGGGEKRGRGVSRRYERRRECTGRKRPW
jgi:hypothetical protein